MEKKIKKKNIKKKVRKTEPVKEISEIMPETHNKNVLVSLFIVILAVIACGLVYNYLKNIDTEPTGPVNVEFYVMSQCPYGTQVEDAIKPVLDVMGDDVNFRLEFIASETNGTFNSLHGLPEVLGDALQLCAQKLYPKDFMKMVVCMNQDASQIPNNFADCALENGLDADAIFNCFNSPEAPQLLSDSINKSDAVGARGSPTMYINGKLYSGSRTPAAFQKAICDSWSKNKPEGCSVELGGGTAAPPSGGC